MGHLYTQAFYPGWGGGVSQDGFSTDAPFDSTAGGIAPAFFLDNGYPQSFTQPPVISAGFDNGKSIAGGNGYRPADANKRPYAHQWNVTVDRELGRHLALSVAYVGSAGRRLPSSIDPINGLDPALLSMGNALYEEFAPGMQSLQGVPLPYAGWVEQLTANGCSPSVAQALRPYPQYCDNLQGMNENHGESLYNSLQLKLEKRFSDGIYALVSYTLSRTKESSSSNTQRGNDSAIGSISPFQADRNYAISSNDTPHVLSAAFVYELPFGASKAHLNESGVTNALVGGWQLSTIFRYSSALPMYFRVNGTACNVPGAFRAACIPAIANGEAVFAQDKGRLRPGRGPAPECGGLPTAERFQLCVRQWESHRRRRARVRLSQPGLELRQEHPIAGEYQRVVPVRDLQLWNWHTFSNSGEFGGQAFNTDLASADFGKWNGSVTDPRTMQLAVRFEF